jgi:hypothetical protein
MRARRFTISDGASSGLTASCPETPREASRAAVANTDVSAGKAPSACASPIVLRRGVVRSSSCRGSSCRGPVAERIVRASARGGRARVEPAVDER